MTTVVTRAGKGSPLTNNEMDSNLTNLNTYKVETNNPSTTGTLTHSGDIVLSGSGKRITGDFDSANQANRVLFQTSTVNGITNVGAIPNGTATQTQFTCFGGADPTNTSAAQMLNTGSEVSYRSAIAGTGTYLPMTFHTGGYERLRIGLSGQLGIGGANYGTAGQVLTSGGAGAAPVWETVAAYTYTTATTPLPATGAAVSVVHGLGVTPSDVVLELTCLAAEFGYSVGDVIQAPSEWNGSSYVTLSLWKNSTRVGFTHSSGYNLLILNKTTGSGVSATAANWSYRFRLKV